MDDRPASIGTQRADTWVAGRVRYPVYYEDTDFSGFVYHANYLKYFERAREDLVGLEMVRDLYLQGIHWVVAKMDLSFHAPARHGDLIEVATRMRLSASPVCLAEQVATRISRRPEEGADLKLVTAKIKLAALSREGEPLRLPDDLVARMHEAAEARVRV